MEKEITCTVCAMGCQILVSGEGERIDRAEGFGCKRGENYARNEFVHPVRILTSTVALCGAAEPLLPIGLDLVVVARSSLPEQSATVLTERFLTSGVKHCCGVSSGEIPCTPNPKYQKPRGKHPAAKQS